ncbi:radical SAM family heme chaperone HemW [Oceanobacillus rekensis]|uniref:radical SAM family heme chaperone HemW n=1 Tax=Oceanobacillus rekensis TaxID=937927 RepID=UPI000B434618|nr:radical SAM family heme chaperone HemW [Oceanobacillus rekensis]
MNKVQSVYIHIPFCRQICHYCDFVKFFYNEQLATEYIEALINEMNVLLPGANHKMSTIYIGGGTPTALNLVQLETLLSFLNEKFDIAGCDEFSIEVNPGDIDEQKTRLLKHYGINRISFGVQVMDDEMLEQLGRVHRVKDVYDTVDLLQKHHFTNISLDLIYALPHQTVEQFNKSLLEALSFGLPHYSTYALQIEPKTIFYQKHKKGKLHRPAEDDEVTMYEILKSTMKSHGIEQYEISNFSVPGFESKHNLTYWSNGYYYGFGAGAHGYLPGKRITNIRPLPLYVKKAMETGRPILEIDEISKKERIEEEMFLGLRKIRGIDKAHFHERFGFRAEVLYKREIEKLIKSGLLHENETAIQLTDKGLLLGNRVFEKFLLDEEYEILIKNNKASRHSV